MFLSIIFRIFVSKFNLIKAMKIKRSDLNIFDVTKHAEELWLKLRWKDGKPVCPYCESTTKQYLCKDGRYKCNCCNRRYSSRVKTIFQNSKLPIQKIVSAIFLILLNDAISAVALARVIGMNYNTSWFLIKRLQYAAIQDIPITGVVAIDEVYLGGKWKNMHFDKKLEILQALGIIPPDAHRFTHAEAMQAIDKWKIPVLGGNDGKRIFLRVLPNCFTSKDITNLLKIQAKKVTIYISDESSVYNDLNAEHEINCHSKKQYISQNGHSSNCVEGVFSHYRRRFRYATIHCKDYYVELYLNLFVFKWNVRDCSMQESFEKLFEYINGKTCRYKDIRQYGNKPNRIEELKTQILEKQKETQQIVDFAEKNKSVVKSVTV